jgi:hypothetical protein
MKKDIKLLIQGQAMALATVFRYNDVAFRDMMRQCDLTPELLIEAEVDEYDRNILVDKWNLG